tara:strand:+ start:15409 stop:15753 length:345 start_codon:yes stop_codon:yes gene_type:complete
MVHVNLKTPPGHSLFVVELPSEYSRGGWTVEFPFKVFSFIDVRPDDIDLLYRMGYMVMAINYADDTKRSFIFKIYRTDRESTLDELEDGAEPPIAEIRVWAQKKYNKKTGKLIT